MRRAFKDLSRPEQREDLLRRSWQMIFEIDQIVVDTEHWNATHPDEKPLDADPDGMLARARAKAVEIVRKLTRRGA